jgi:hypothetical protein
MINKMLSDRKTILLLLFLQLIPLFAFPLSVYKPTSQEWWLAALMGIFAIVGIIQVLRGSTAMWPWYLMGFAQGFNIISRLMMIWPHIIIVENGQQVFNAAYTIIAVVTMLGSMFMLYYLERPDVRMVMFRK